MSGDRPAPSAPSRGHDPGAFRVRTHPPQQHYRVAIEVAYDEHARADVIRRELTEAMALAFGEIDKRFR